MSEPSQIRELLARATEAAGPDGLLHILALASHGESPSLLQREWDRLVEDKGAGVEGASGILGSLLDQGGSRRTHWTPTNQLIIEAALHGIGRREPWFQPHEEEAQTSFSHALSPEQAEHAAALLDLADVLQQLCEQTNEGLADPSQETVRQVLVRTMWMLHGFRRASAGLHPQRSPIPGWAVEHIRKVAEAAQVLSVLLSPTETTESEPIEPEEIPRGWSRDPLASGLDEDILDALSDRADDLGIPGDDADLFDGDDEDISVDYGDVDGDLDDLDAHLDDWDRSLIQHEAETRLQPHEVAGIQEIPEPAPAPAPLQDRGLSDEELTAKLAAAEAEAEAQETAANPGGERPTELTQTQATLVDAMYEKVDMVEALCRPTLSQHLPVNVASVLSQLQQSNQEWLAGREGLSRTQTWIGVEGLTAALSMLNRACSVALQALPPAAAAELSRLMEAARSRRPSPPPLEIGPGMGLPIQRDALPIGAHARPWIGSPSPIVVTRRPWGGYPAASRLSAAEVRADGTWVAYKLDGSILLSSRWEGDPEAGRRAADAALVECYGSPVFGLGR